MDQFETSENHCQYKPWEMHWLTCNQSICISCYMATNIRGMRYIWAFAPGPNETKVPTPKFSHQGGQGKPKFPMNQGAPSEIPHEISIWHGGLPPWIRRPPQKLPHQESRRQGDPSQWPLWRHFLTIFAPNITKSFKVLFPNQICNKSFGSALPPPNRFLGRALEQEAAPGPLTAAMCGGPGSWF